MAKGTLTASKPSESRRRRNAPAHADKVVTRDDVKRGPDLPAGYLSPQTYLWWDTWQRSPQAQLFEETDWQRLLMLAPMVDNYWRKPYAAALAEIRMNEERLGATLVDRMRARITVTADEAPAAPLAPVVSIREEIAQRSRAGK